MLKAQTTSVWEKGEKYNNTKTYTVTFYALCTLLVEAEK